MANPQLVVEIAFGYTWDDTSPSWTDVSTYVREASWTRGRSTEFDTFSAGTATVVLSNQDRRFDPLYSSGAYYGNLKPMVPIRIRAYHNSTYYDRFYGYVDGFPQHYDKGNTDSTVTLRATDAFKVLQNLVLPQSVYETVVIADGPLTYLPLGEDTGTRAVDKSGNRCDGYYYDTIERGASSLLAYSDNKAIKLSGTSSANGAQGVIVTDASSVAVAAASSFSVELWLQSNEGADPAYGMFFSMVKDGTGYYMDSLGPTYSSGGIGEITFVTGTTANYFQNIDLFDAQPHHIVFVKDGSTYTYYVDGEPHVVNATAGAGGSANQGPNSVVVGSKASASWVSFPGIVDEASWYDFALSSTQVNDHYAAGAAPWDADSTGTRIGRVLDLIGWPAALRDIDVGEVTLGPAALNGASALAYLQQIANTEQGRLFVAGDGKITFHAKDRFLVQSTESTAQATFSDDGADNPYAELSFDYNDSYIYNDATVTREGGLPQTSENTTSQASYGKRSKSVSGLLLADDRASRAVADYIVYRYQDPQLRVDNFEVRPTTTGQWTAVLALKLGYRINMERTPQATGSAIDIDCHLESISESVTPDEWRITMTASPADNASYLKWGTGVWGTEVWR